MILLPELLVSFINLSSFDCLTSIKHKVLVCSASSSNNNFSSSIIFFSPSSFSSKSLLFTEGKLILILLLKKVVSKFSTIQFNVIIKNYKEN